MTTQQLLSNEVNFLVESIGKGCPKKTALSNFMLSLEPHVGFGAAMYATGIVEKAIKNMKRETITRENLLATIRKGKK